MAAVKSVVVAESPSVTFPAEIISILSGELTAPIIIFPLVVVVKTISFPAPVAVADVDTVKSPLVVVITHISDRAYCSYCYSTTYIIGNGQISRSCGRSCYGK